MKFVYSSIVRTMTNAYCTIAGITIFFVSCSTSKNTLTGTQNRELLKQFAFCRCTEVAIEKFVRKDPAEMSSASVLEKMDYYGLYNKNVSPVLDSIARAAVAAEEKNLAENKGRHESMKGSTSYALRCLMLYKSKQLDSLVRSFQKGIYELQYSNR